LSTGAEETKEPHRREQRRERRMACIMESMLTTEQRSRAKSDFADAARGGRKQAAREEEGALDR